MEYQKTLINKNISKKMPLVPSAILKMAGGKFANIEVSYCISEKENMDFIDMISII